MPWQGTGRQLRLFATQAVPDDHQLDQGRKRPEGCFRDHPAGRTRTGGSTNPSDRRLLATAILCLIPNYTRPSLLIDLDLIDLESNYSKD
jgi:hypothetical protein